MSRHFQTMTEAALGASCDSYDNSMTMLDLAEEYDDRPVTIFFRHNPVELSCLRDHGSLGEGVEREVIGVVIGDGLRVVLDREESIEMFGLDVVQRWEGLVK